MCKLKKYKPTNQPISQKKLQLGNKIKFAGRIISNEGYSPDNEKYATIAEFPKPRA